MNCGKYFYTHGWKYAMGYGAFRKALIVHNAQVETKTYKYLEDDKTYIETQDMKPMLLSQKIGLTVASALSAVYVWPIYLFWDACNLEVKARGLKDGWRLLPKPRLVIDYLIE